MAILTDLTTTNKNGSNIVELLNATVIHQDAKVMIVSVDEKFLESIKRSFWITEEKIISIHLGDGEFKHFHSKTWMHDCDAGNQSIIKFYADPQNWFEAVNLDLSYEYNEYVVGYVVTDDDTGRTVNFQFKDNGDLDYGLEGDDTYQAFEENELKEIKEWLRSNKDVSELEENYSMAMELPRDENGFHPIAEILANGDGITKQQILDLAQANQ